MIDERREALPDMVALQLELSLIPAYRGVTPIDKMLGHLVELGFAIEGIEPGHTDPSTGRLMEADGIFVQRLAPTR